VEQQNTRAHEVGAQPEVLTIEDVMRIAQISQTTALRWVKGTLPGTPRLPAVRIGRQWRIRRGVLMEHLAIA
jgi:hypothetical protein